MKVLHSFTIVHDCQSSPFFFHSDEHILAETFKNPRNFSLAIMSRDAMAMASLAFCLRLPRHRRNHRRDRDGDDRDEGTAATAAAMDGRSLGAKAKYHRATGAKVKDVSKIEVPGIPTTIKTMGVNITTIAYLRILTIEIGQTIILMVVEAQGSVSNEKNPAVTPLKFNMK